MELFDLHVDTALRLYREGLSFTSPLLGASAHDGEVFARITRIYALFSHPTLSDDEAYRAFFPMRERLLSELASYKSPDFSLLLACEDARLLGGERHRLRVLRECGVRILTLTWRGATCIGGAYDTSVGLTPFGRTVLTDCYALGILPDLSHASDATFYEVAEAAAAEGRPLLATHSNARSVCRHPRNLTDDEITYLD